MRKVIVASILLLLGLILTPAPSRAAQIVHKVKQADNLYTIAKKYHVSVDLLKKQNNLKSIKLSLGQTLIIKPQDGRTANKETRAKYNVAKTKKTEAPEVASAGEESDGDFIVYKTKKGDTIDKVAALFNVDKEELIESNNLQVQKGKGLPPGRTILIPKVVDEGEEEIVVLNTKPLKTWKSTDEKYMLVKVAKSFMGAPYKYGGNTLKGLDCSAYVKKIYEIFDVQLPRSARDQIKIGPSVRREDLAVGDLVFFRTKRYVKYPTHVGIYVGEGNFIHSSSGQGRIGVKIDSLSSDYYSKAYIGATRVKGNIEEIPGATTTSEKPSSNS